MRLRQTWTLMGTQEPEGLDGTMLNLPQIKILHRMKSAVSLKAIAMRDGRLDKEAQQEAAGLMQAEAIILCNETTQPGLRQRVVQGG